MAYFYKNDQLHVGTPTKSIAIADLLSKFDHPVYIYDLDEIEQRIHHLQTSFGSQTHIHYAMKANSHLSILRLIAKNGLGVDTVSVGEIERALEAGFSADKIIFSGVGKTKKEIRRAIELKIKQINIESLPELTRVLSLAEEARARNPANFQQVSVALRINPDVNPQTHPYITTGFRENKFGLDPQMLDELPVAQLSSDTCAVHLRGLTMHIGSQLLDIDAIKEAAVKMQTLRDQIEARGFKLDRLDIGGGLGIDYDSADHTQELSLAKALGEFASSIRESRKVHILIEPGRWLVARSGVLCGQIQYVKKTSHKNFVILNTGMNHLLRPALYQAKHRILPLLKPTSATHLYDVVGPICESADVLAREVQLPELKEDDWLAIADTGAYGFSMASKYNLHELPAEITVSLK